MVRIAYLSSIYPRASDTFVRREIDELRDLGHDVIAFSVRRAPTSELADPAVQAESAKVRVLLDSVPLLAIDLVWAVVTRSIDFAATLALAWRTRGYGLSASLKQLAYLVEATVLARALLQLKIEHLHNHIGENSATVAMLSSRLSGVPFSLTIHGPGIFAAPARWALSEKIQRASFTACISHFCRSQCMTYAPIDSWSRIAIVRCGLPDDYSTNRLTPPPEGARFVNVGRLCAEKAQMILLRAVWILVDEGIDVHLDLVGDGELRGDLEQAISDWKLGENVRLWGWRTSREVVEHISCSRALVMPSFSEGLPVALMEALALERPVIATNIAGVSELVAHGENGWLVSPGDEHGLAAAMREAAELPTSELETMGRSGARTIAERHSIRKEALRLETLILQSIQEQVSNCGDQVADISRVESETASLRR